MASEATITEIASFISLKKRQIPDPFGSDFYQDLVALYGLKRDPVSSARNNLMTFEELSMPVMDYFLHERKLPKPDVLIVSHLVPNCVSYNSTTSMLLDRYQLEAYAFAISDQGTAPMLTAMRLCRDLLGGPRKRAIILGIDQTSVPLNHAVLDEREAVDTCIGLYVDSDVHSKGLSFVDYRTHKLGSQTVSDLTTGLLRDHGVTSESVRAVASPLGGPEGNFRSVVQTSSRHLTTGVFEGLLEVLTGRDEMGYLLLQDQSLGRLSQLLLARLWDPVVRRISG